ncbi:MAG: response regulator [Pseudomonadota bacterium]
MFELPIPTSTWPVIETLVLIDDDTVDQMICKRIVERSGLVRRFVPFLNGRDALNFLRQRERPDVDALLVDINMPGMSGLDFLEAACREHGTGFAKIVVIMLTASLSPRDTDRAAELDLVNDYFDKPLNREHLDKIAGDLCGGRPSAF